MTRLDTEAPYEIHHRLWVVVATVVIVVVVDTRHTLFLFTCRVSLATCQASGYCVPYGENFSQTTLKIMASTKRPLVFQCSVIVFVINIPSTGSAII